jgi:NADH-quinone oxidoreductase subunit K
MKKIILICVFVERVLVNTELSWLLDIVCLNLADKLSFLNLFHCFTSHTHLNLREVVEPTNDFLYNLGLISLFGGIYFVVINSKTLLHSMMYLEIMYLGLILTFVGSSSPNSLAHNQIYALFITTIAAAESAVGLGLVISIFRLFYSSDIRFFSVIKG